MDSADRLARIEARLAAIEARLGMARTQEPPQAVPPTAPHAPAWPAPAPTAAPARAPAVRAEPKPKPAHSDLERFVGLAVLGRIGIGAIVLAAAYFAQLGWGHLSPAARVLAIELGAAVMLGLGFALRQRVAAYYVALLFGGASALSYLGIAVAQLRYELLGSGVAMALLVASAALGQFLARTIHLQAMATVSLAGAYAAPVLVGSPSASPTMFFAYLLALHTWAACTEHWWQWIWARRLAVTATTVLAGAWFVGARLMPSTWSVVLHIEAVWFLVIAPELLRAFTKRPITKERWLILITGSWVTQLALLTWTVAEAGAPSAAPLAGVLLLALGIALRQADCSLPRRGAAIAQIGAVMLALGASTMWNPAPSDLVYAWSQPWPRLGSLLLVGAVLIGTRRWSGTSDLGLAAAILCAKLTVLTQDQATSRALALVALLLPAALLVFGHNQAGPIYALIAGSSVLFFGLSNAWDFGGAGAGWLCAAFAATAAWLTIGSGVATAASKPVLRRAVGLLQITLALYWSAGSFSVLTRTEVTPAVLNFRCLAMVTMVVLLATSHRLAGSVRKEDRVLLLIPLLVMVYLGPLAEILTAVSGWPPGTRAITVSLYTLVFSGILLAAGFLKKRPPLRWAGLAGFGIATAKVAVHDLRDLDTPMRMLLTAGLGVALLLGAYAYARLRRASEPERDA